MTVGIIVQARLTSSRFPNKVLCPLNGITVIDRVIAICQKTNLPFCIAIAPSLGNRGLESYIDSRCEVFHLGSNDQDVVDRFFQVNKIMKFDTIIRVCADSPLIDLRDFEDIQKLYSNRKKYTRLNQIEIFSKEELEYVWMNEPFIARRED